MDAATLQYPTRELPAPGKFLDVAPGVRWLRMKLPFALDHINLWLLEDQGGWTAIDCGIGDEATRALWDEQLRGLTLRRVLVTHHHPDHAGNAAWLTQRFGIDLWMTQAEFLSAHATRLALAGHKTELVLELFARHGLEAARREVMGKRGNHYKVLVPKFPEAYRRIFDGDTIRIGARDWAVRVGFGHAPEHASLYCRQEGVLISGDMLLPSISTNVSVWSTDPEGDPLRRFLESIRRYRELPADTLVLPSHGRPFQGAHERVAQLEAHHEARLADLVAACTGQPHCAAEVLELLFRRALDPHQTFFAMGEAIAHLNHLWHAGRLERRADSAGVLRFGRA